MLIVGFGGVDVLARSSTGATCTSEAFVATILLSLDDGSFGVQLVWSVDVGKGTSGSISSLSSR